MCPSVFVLISFWLLQCNCYYVIITSLVLCNAHHTNTGPEDVVIQPLSPVGTPQGRGEDTYKSSVTRATGNHGDTFICMASNGASMATANYTISAALPPANVTVNQVAPSVLNIQWTQPSGRSHDFIMTSCDCHVTIM